MFTGPTQRQDGLRPLVCTRGSETLLRLPRSTQLARGRVSQDSNPDLPQPLPHGHRSSWQSRHLP